MGKTRIPQSLLALSERDQDALCELAVVPRATLSLVYHLMASGNAWKRFEKPKSRGGVRVIHEPSEPMKELSRGLLKHVVQRLLVHRAIHGAGPGTSVVTNARRHAGFARSVYNLDLKDAFPSVGRAQIEKVLGRKIRELIGASVDVSEESVGRLYEAVVEFLLVDDRIPQGFPTSSGVLNAVLYPVDRAIGKYLEELRETTGQAYRFTRYVDDITVSTSGEGIERNVRKHVQAIIRRNKWELNMRKVRYHGAAPEGDDERSTKMPVVTGLVIHPDGRVTVPRPKLLKWRAFMNDLLAKGTVTEQERASVSGIVGYLYMVYDTSLPATVRKPYLAAKAKFGIGRVRETDSDVYAPDLGDEEEEESDAQPEAVAE